MKAHDALGYNEEMQQAAKAAFADATGEDFWSEVQKLQDARHEDNSKLVEKRPIRSEG